MLVLVLVHPQIDLVVVASSEAIKVATTTKSIAGAPSSGDAWQGGDATRSSHTVVCALFTPRMEPQHVCYRNA